MSEEHSTSNDCSKNNTDDIFFLRLESTNLISNALLVRLV
jgi:hypothetical protein